MDTTSNFDIVQYDSHTTSQDNNINHNNPVDIRLQQEMSANWFSKTKLRPSNIMEIDIFNMLRASNAPLVLFDCIIDQVEIHEGNIIENRSNSLLVRDRNISLIRIEVSMRKTYL